MAWNLQWLKDKMGLEGRAAHGPHPHWGKTRVHACEKAPGETERTESGAAGNGKQAEALGSGCA